MGEKFDGKVNEVCITGSDVLKLEREEREKKQSCIDKGPENDGNKKGKLRTQVDQNGVICIASVVIVLIVTSPKLHFMLIYVFSDRQ